MELERPTFTETYAFLSLNLIKKNSKLFILFNRLLQTYLIDNASTFCQCANKNCFPGDVALIVMFLGLELTSLSK